MRMGLDLIPGDDTPLVARGEALFTRGDIRARADDLSAAITERGISRVLVRSDDSALILEAIDACDRAGADLFIAHTTIAEDRIEAICAEHGIGLVLNGERDWRTATPSPSESRIYMMTSGTTGMPKVAGHSLQSLLAKAKAGVKRRPDQGGRWVLTYQPTGFAGIQVSLTAALWGGLLITPSERTIGGFYHVSRHWNGTHISGTPTFWRSFLMVADPTQLSLQQITLGGEAADQATLDRIRKAFPDTRVTHTYASTEAGVVYAVHDGLEGFPAAWLEAAPSGVALRIKDGFLQIKTPHMMSGYLSAASQPLLDDGWLATADLVELAGDRVKVLGRDDNTINVGGSKVYPLPVEALILKQDGVVEARVYGQPNPVTGALVAADVVLEAGADEKAARKAILTACREALPAYSVPRSLNFVDKIAVSAANKKG
ncbi:fatty acid--CoA ligase family protein [Asticcacaulis sp. SL142]|uniref:class I adenylate-forming enzyme family protein n=1 Tax=Asticcacaulis sp. SL142 TaxID=2995155 RepID=UPI00226D31C1|nr:fatty acid--CoA ligase family protein [Asticcacaulis sp. SL142]WAC47276.1 fatty acid--CoA ligase family protein [Asticcacaulis sp. SL142]